MTCREFIERLLEYDGGELSAALKQALHHHEEICPPCEGYHRSYRETSLLCRAALDDPEDPGGSEDLPEDLLRRIVESARRPR